MKNSFIIILSLILIACVNDNNFGRGKSTNPVNEELKQEAKEIFKDKLENEGSYHSYSSSDVFYEIRSEKMNMSEFKNYQNKILPEKKWIYNKKVDQAYIFCQGTRQLEIIPPQVLIGNEDLGSGDMGRQLEDTWNVMFSHTFNGTLNRCYLESRGTSNR